MFSKQELKELAGYRSKTTPVLSIHLNVDLTQITTDQYRLALKGLLKSVADKAARQDIEAVERFFELEYDRQSKGVILFSCAAENFWQVYHLAVPVRDHAYVSAQPYIKQLADILDAFDSYGVAMVDREGGRLYLFYLGALQDATGTFGDNLRAAIRTASGRGGRSGKGAAQNDWTANLKNRIDQLVNRNLREVADLTQEFYRAGECERIILAGTDENRARFMGLLPKDLQSKVIGGFAIDMSASVMDVLERSLQVVQASVAERKTNLVRNIITAAYKNNGSLGLAATLMAVQEKRVQTLAISDDYEAPGAICSHCGYMTAQESEVCSICGNPAHRQDDIVDSLVRQAVLNDIEVAFVQDEAFREAGAIGALWRF